MSLLRRYYSEGQSYFVTIVTYDRQPLLTLYAGVILGSMEKCKVIFELDYIAWVILPDHCHFVIDPRNSDLSVVIHRFKMTFAGEYRKLAGHTSGRLWQHRFWDHVMRDQEDMNRHIDYIHFNPVHHGYTHSPFDYQLSSAKLYLERGNYQPDWGLVAKYHGNQFGDE